MIVKFFFHYVLLLKPLQVSSNILYLDHDNWPTFQPTSCSSLTDVDAKYTLCLKVTFPGDAHHDYMLLEKIESAFKTYQGIMKEEPITVVFNEPDTDDGETTGGVSSYTIVFFLYLYD